MGDYKYKAFISYSHKDRKWTRWLHRRLETYPIPKNIVGKTTPAGIIPRRLKPIFRDREELSASNNLGEKIQAALASSKNLIIICSPAAAKSKWVNQEILTFKQNNRDAQLFSVIVEGEPYASTMPGREAEECFPPALRFEVNEDGTLSDIPAEPLAADLRPHADGKRLGFLKLLSGMIGVGLDEVVQRDMKRSRKRVTAITTGSLATVLAMGTLTGFALDARAEAEKRRQDSENLADFMITDLRKKLEPVGRIDVMDGVAKKVLEYYDNIGPEKLGCTEQLRQAKALVLGAEVAYKEDDKESFFNHSSKAYKVTEDVLKSCDDPSAIFEHAQSTFWSGYYASRHGRMEFAETQFNRYKSLAQLLLAQDTDSAVYKNEVAETHVNIGSIHLKQKQFGTALENFQDAILHYEELLQMPAQEIEYSLGYANAVGYAARANYFKGNIKKAKALRNKEIEISTELYKTAGDKVWKATQILAPSHRNLARLEYLEENYSHAMTHASLAEKYYDELRIHDSGNTQWMRGLGKSQAMLIAAGNKNNDKIISNAARIRLINTLSFLPNQTEASLVASLAIGGT